jgi:transcriptional regulator with XRE-family HTH domain
VKKKSQPPKQAGKRVTVDELIRLGALPRQPQPPPMRTFGEQIEELCRERGLQKQEIAERTGISPAQLSHYLRYGTSSNMIDRISGALGISPDYFDSYVANLSPYIVASHPELLDFIRKLHRASPIDARWLVEEHFPSK